MLIDKRVNSQAVSIGALVDTNKVSTLGPNNSNNPLCSYIWIASASCHVVVCHIPNTLITIRIDVCLCAQCQYCDCDRRECICSWPNDHWPIRPHCYVLVCPFLAFGHQFFLISRMPILIAAALICLARLALFACAWCLSFCRSLSVAYSFTSHSRDRAIVLSNAN